MKISKRYSRLGTESAFEILSKAQKLASEGREIINLGIGQPDFSTPKHVVDSCKKALDDGYHGYTEPNGTLELREGVSNYIQRIYNIKINSSRINHNQLEIQINKDSLIDVVIFLKRSYSKIIQVSAV